MLLALIAFVKWRMGVIVLFLWFLVEDVLRRLIPGQPFEVIFLKEIFVLAIYGSFFLAIRYRPGMRDVIKRLPFGVPLIIFFVVNILSFAYTWEPSIGMALLGFRSHFWYLPFILLGYFMFKSEFSYQRFVSALILVSIPLTVFAVFQLVFYDHIDFVLMRPFEIGDPVHSFLDEEVTFISSLFGSHGRFARFSLMLFFLGLGLIDSNTNSFLLTICLVHSAAGVFISGQRTPMYLSVIGLSLFGFLLFIGRKRQRNFHIKSWRLIIIAVTAITAIAILLFIWFPLLGEYFLHFSSVFERFTEFVPSDIKKSANFVGVHGAGLGLGSQGNHFVAGFTGVEPMKGIESGIGKVWYEIGLPGFLAFLIVTISFSISILYRLFTYRTNSQKAIVASIFIFYISILFEFYFLHAQVLGDGTTLIPLWFFVGVIFGIEKWPLVFKEDKKDEL